jgi:tRNA 2-thiocytidine biosynthesis protein TtcA
VRAMSSKKSLLPLEKKLLHLVGKANEQFSMIERGDRVMVAVSGGKDSYTLLHLLRLVQRRAPVEFETIAVNLDQGHPGFPGHLLENYLKEHAYDYRMIAQDTYSIVLDKVPAGKTYCSLCSRLRRGILYRTAKELGCTKIALGHHRDDLIETLLLNVFYAGQIKSMAPYLAPENGAAAVIRPLAFCAEEDVAALAKELAFPIIPCNLCGSQDNMHRQRVKKLVADLHAENPKVKPNLLAALGNVVPSHLLDPSILPESDADIAPRPIGTDAWLEGL